MMVVHWKTSSGRADKDGQSVHEVKYDLGPVRLGRWNQWSFDITWSTARTPGSIVVRLDGAEVGSHRGPNSYHQDTAPITRSVSTAPTGRPRRGTGRGTADVVNYYDDVTITPISPGTPVPPGSTTPAPNVTTTSPPDLPDTSASPSGQVAGPAPVTVSTTTAPATPGPVSETSDEIPVDTDTDTGTGNTAAPLHATGVSDRTPLLLAFGGTLLSVGLLFVFRARARTARRRAGGRRGQRRAGAAPTPPPRRLLFDEARVEPRLPVRVRTKNLARLREDRLVEGPSASPRRRTLTDADARFSPPIRTSRQAPHEEGFGRIRTRAPASCGPHKRDGCLEMCLGTFDRNSVSTLPCPRCDGRPRCLCAGTREVTSTQQPYGTNEFGQEWVRSYLSLHETVTDDGVTATTVAWVVPERTRGNGRRSSDYENPVPPVMLTRTSHRRTSRVPRRRPFLPLATALSALAGTATIAGPTLSSTSLTPSGRWSRPPRAASKCSTASRAGPDLRRRAGHARLHRTAPSGPQRHPGTARCARRHQPRLPAPPRTRKPCRSPRPARVIRAAGTSRHLPYRVGAFRAPRRPHPRRRLPSRARHCAATTGDPRSSNCSDDSRGSACGPIPNGIASTGISTTRCSCPRRITGSTTTRPESTGRPLDGNWNP